VKLLSKPRFGDRVPPNGFQRREAAADGNLFRALLGGVEMIFQFGFGH
jgi:hypothetical protein